MFSPFAVSPAVELVQGRQEVLDARIRNSVPERLALPAERDQSLLAHLAEVLGERGLRKSDGLRERAHVRLAPLDQLAQDHEAPLVGERTHDAGHFDCGLLDPTRIEGLGRHDGSSYFRYC